MPAARPPAIVVVEDEHAPLTCPPFASSWNLHPRVYLTRKPGDKEVICPYCSTRYVLPADDKEKSA